MLQLPRKRKRRGKVVNKIDMFGTLDPSKDRELVVWWNTLQKSNGHDVAMVFSDWLQERGLIDQAEDIMKSDCPTLRAKRMFDLTKCKWDGLGNMYVPKENE